MPWIRFCRERVASVESAYALPGLCGHSKRGTLHQCRSCCSRARCVCHARLGRSRQNESRHRSFRLGRPLVVCLLLNGIKTRSRHLTPCGGLPGRAWQEVRTSPLGSCPRMCTGSFCRKNVSRKLFTYLAMVWKMLRHTANGIFIYHDGFFKGSGESNAESGQEDRALGHKQFSASPGCAYISGLSSLKSSAVS